MRLTLVRLLKHNVSQTKSLLVKGILNRCFSSPQSSPAVAARSAQPSPRLPAFDSLADVLREPPEPRKAPCPCQKPCTVFHLCQRARRLVIKNPELAPHLSAHIPLPRFSITTLNVHCPIYKRLSDGTLESADEARYMARNARIVRMLLAHPPPSVICLQEFWLCSEKVLALYHEAAASAGYNMYITPRTNCRGDGLLTLVATSRFTVLDHHDISYQECGDRVAHLLHLQSKGAAPGEGELLLVNTHLMFPHDDNSQLIRLRQCTKLLAFLHQYTTQRGLTELPLVVCGDWNGEPNGSLARFMRAQGFVSVYCEHTQGGPRWVSHLNHRAEAVGVDYIWLLNPSSQVGSLTANWRQLVCGCVIARLAERGVRTQEAAFRFFDRRGAGVFTVDEFVAGVTDLQLIGPGGIGLIDAEIRGLAAYLDVDHDGEVAPADLRRVLDMAGGLRALARAGWDAVEFLMAYAAQTAQFPIPTPLHPLDLQILHASLPDGFRHGVWPEGFEHNISDHAPVSAVLKFSEFDEYGA